MAEWTTLWIAEGKFIRCSLSTRSVQDIYLRYAVRSESIPPTDSVQSPRPIIYWIPP